MIGTRTFASNGGSGQRHVYTFGNGSYHDSDPPEESDGMFQWVPGNNTATLKLSYTAPADFAGDTHDLTLHFGSKDQGTFESTYRRVDGATVIINGDFAFEPIP